MLIGLVGQRFLPRGRPVFKTIIHGLDFGHGVVNASEKGCVVRLKSPRDIVVLVLSIVIVVVIVFVIVVVVVVVVIVIVVVVNVVVIVVVAGTSDLLVKELLAAGASGSNLLASASGSSLLEGASGFVATSLVGLVGQRLFSRCSCLLTLLLHERRARAAVLLVSQTCKSGLPLLSPQSLAGEPDVEAAAAKPQEDGSGGRPVSFLGTAFGRKSVRVDAPDKEAFGKK